MPLIEGPEGYYSFAPAEDFVAPNSVCNWPFSESCYKPADTADPGLVETAMTLTVATLRSLTLYRVGGCPITVRPCVARRCFSTFNPHIGVDGQWVNSCHCTDRTSCPCGPSHSIFLPPPIGDVVSVTIDGTTLDPSAYRVDDYRELVRLDGQAWPVDQDMDVAAGEPGSFTVTYLNAYKPDAGGAWAASLLLKEFMKACSGDTNCTLSPRVTSVARRGISSEIREAVLSDGRTGIAAVDAWVQVWNPHLLRTRPMLYSPELTSTRRTTFP